MFLAQHGGLQIGNRGASPANARLGEFPLQSSLVSLDRLAERMVCVGCDAILGEEVVVDKQ
jgi:hypothetical protein